MKTKVWAAAELQLGRVPFDVSNHTEEEMFLLSWQDCVNSADTVFLIGNAVAREQAYWYSRLKEMPGEKVLMLGDSDRNRYAWYRKFGFVDVVPYNRFVLYPYYLWENGRGKPYYGQIMFSYIPAFPAVCGNDQRFITTSAKYERYFDLHSCILNVHGLTLGRGQEKHNTFDASVGIIGNQLVTIDQIAQLKLGLPAQSSDASAML